MNAPCRDECLERYSEFLLRPGLVAGGLQGGGPRRGPVRHVQTQSTAQVITFQSCGSFRFMGQEKISVLYMIAKHNQKSKFTLNTWFSKPKSNKFCLSNSVQKINSINFPLIIREEDLVESVVHHESLDINKTFLNGGLLLHLVILVLVSVPAKRPKWYLRTNGLK